MDRLSGPTAGDADGIDGPVRVDDPSYLVGVPDEFQRLWTPHRMVYIQQADPGHEGCPFCVVPTLSDEDALIVARGEHAYALLNLFPYNSGHLLVCPYRHIALYDEATPEEVAEIGSLTQTAMRVIREVSHNDGFNRAPPPAHRAALGAGRELLPDHRAHQGAPAAARRGSRRAGGRLAEGRRVATREAEPSERRALREPGPPKVSGPA